MSEFKTFIGAITPTIDEIYSLAEKEHSRRTKFLVKLARAVMQGAKNGIFPTEILDPVRNIQANLNDKLEKKDVSEKLKEKIIHLDGQLEYFGNTLQNTTAVQKKVIFGLQYLLFLHKVNHLTYGRLATLFIALNGDDLDLEAEVFEGPHSSEPNSTMVNFKKEENKGDKEEQEEIHEGQSVAVLD